LLGLCLVRTNSFAQAESLLLMQDTTKAWHSLILLNSNNAVGSNALDLGFLKESIWGGYLEETQIENQLDRMKNTNRLGGYSFSSLHFFNFTDTLFNDPEWGLRASISTNYVASAFFKKDMFSLAYLGNKRSDTLAIGPARGLFQAYQKFSVGLFSKKNWNSISLGLVVGQSMRDISLYQTRMHTTALGDTISAVYNGTYQRSDTLARGMANGSGLGLAFDLNYQLPMANNKGLISIALQDVGFMLWNRNSEQYTFKGKTQWTGIDLGANLFELDSISRPVFKDSINYTYNKKNIIKALPARIDFRYFHILKHQSFYEFGIYLMPGTAALPRVYAGLGQRPFPSVLFTQGVSYGGFGNWGLSAGIQYLPKQSWYISIQTQHLGGFTMSSAKSRHLSFTIAKIL
jgi:Family of unknown function (DUF5723)